MAHTQAVVYDGNIHEAYAGTRIKVYGNQKIKSSMALPPDPDCVTQDIVRAHYQCYYWVHSLQQIISPIPFQDMDGSCIANLMLLGQCGLKSFSFHYC